mmetsp:Transcript_41423/g.65637  ORF Transcript_41423/g.65637 Transcript_41423/m.65637 type:complete len:391 (-) Transcript_41423:46-1218(-)
MVASLAQLARSYAAVLAAGFLVAHGHEDDCEAMLNRDTEASSTGDQSLIQFLRMPLAKKFNNTAMGEIRKAKDVSWTTNMGQKHHKCKGSRFEVDFTGTHKGLVVKNGMLLAKGDCHHEGSSRSKPVLSQGLTCESKATGCHMWCAPVWQSYYDSTDWSAFDSRCKDWDGDFKEKDLTCRQAGRLFTWARTVAPNARNALELTFAIADGCKHWCSPLWVTIYDPSNWAKSFRWCFNQKDQFGVCDRTEDVALNGWQSRKFQFHDFLQKHGYDADEYAVELAVYSEFDKAEVLINEIKFVHVAEKAITTSPPPDKPQHSIKKCGSQKTCGGEEHCCRKGDSTVDAKCCPSAWSCCEDSCCPASYICAITQFGHTCTPPKHEEPKKPDLCNI